MGFAVLAASAYSRPMPRKPIEIPPAAAKAFMRDLKAFFKETDPNKRDLIAGDQMRALWEHPRRQARQYIGRESCSVSRDEDGCTSS